MYSTRENCVFIWKLFNNRTADEYDMVHVRVEFDSQWLFSKRTWDPALDHDKNRMTYHEYQGMFDIALF